MNLKYREIAYKAYVYQFQYHTDNAAFEDNPDEENRIVNKYVRKLDNENSEMFEQRKILDLNGNTVGWVRKVRRSYGY